MDRALDRLVWHRAKNCCEYCHIPQIFDELFFELDHIIALQHDGRTVSMNLCIACYFCNHYKGPNLAGWDKKSRAVVRLFHPRHHSWRRHFSWEGPMLIGRTAIGRVTVAVLKINQPRRVLLRQQLIEEGVFPI